MLSTKTSNKRERSSLCVRVLDVTIVDKSLYFNGLVTLDNEFSVTLMVNVDGNIDKWIDVVRDSCRIAVACGSKLMPREPDLVRLTARAGTRSIGYGVFFFPIDGVNLSSLPNIKITSTNGLVELLHESVKLFNNKLGLF